MEEYNKSYGAIKLASLLSHAQSQSPCFTCTHVSSVTVNTCCSLVNRISIVPYCLPGLQIVLTLFSLGRGGGHIVPALTLTNYNF